ncbi:MAG: helix-turn-helix domain-containing protein [Vicinamibacterales bacterium]|nr:helix-turn-helix domain-containing protein [Vicinamibacterales bacterium]
MGELTDPGTRGRLLRAAVRAYSDHGYLGATTRRIAEAAGLNEVTLFRLFGSKDALVEQAVHAHAMGEPAATLPSIPKNPDRELGRWCRSEIERLRCSRDLLRKCFAEAADHPELVSDATRGMVGAGTALRNYVAALEDQGFKVGRTDRSAAIAMLLSVLFSDALGREDLSEIYALEASEAPAVYARVFLRALGFARSPR